MENPTILIPFEEVIESHRLEKGKYLILGEPGTGKTTLALQYIQSGLTNGTPLLYISFKKSDNRLVDLSRDNQLKKKDTFHYIIWESYIKENQVTLKQIQQVVKKYKPKYIVLDDIHIASQDWPEKEIRDFLKFLNTCARGILITSLPSHLSDQSGRFITKLSDYSDGLLELRYIPINNQMRLWVWVRKHGDEFISSSGKFCTITEQGIRSLKEKIVSTIAIPQIQTRSMNDTHQLVLPEILYFSNHHEKRIRRRVDEYNQKHPTSQVRLPEKQINSILEYNQLIQQFEEGNSPFACLPIDLFRLQEFAERELIHPLDDYFPESLQNQYVDIAIQQGRYRGRIYAIPHYLNVGVMAYRKDLLDKYGKIPPVTWDELVDTSQTILTGEQNRSLYGYGFQGAQFENISCNFLEFIWGNGGDIYDLSGHVIINREESIEALQFMQDLIYQYKLSPPETPFMMESHTVQKFIHGEFVCMRTWPRIVSQAELPNSYVSGKVGIIPLPVGPSGKSSVPVIGGFGYVIPRSVPDPEPVWQFLSSLMVEEALFEFATTGWECPPLKYLYEDKKVLEMRPYYKQMTDLIPKGRLRQLIPNYPILTDLIKRETHLVLRNEKPPDEALNSIANELHKSIHRRMHTAPIQRASEYIYSHLKEPLSRDTVANAIGISSSHFSVLFKEVTGQTFTDFVIKTRIEEARRLLGKSEFNVSQVAQEVGFNDESYFSYMFKRYTGVTPTYYRMNLQASIRSL